MAAPSSGTLASTWGYHPAVGDIADIVSRGSFEQLLVFGQRVPDVVDRLGETRIDSPPTDLPTGVYWFSGLEQALVLLVLDGSPAAPGEHHPWDQVSEGSALDNALGWAEEAWGNARQVPKPAFAAGAEVIVMSTGSDGIVKEGRRFIIDRWNYTVFSAGGTTRADEAGLKPRPLVDDAAAWVESAPVAPGRFAATLTRAKLRANFTDTVYSFRATRTMFRPYQFKPVLKLLDTGALRLLIADEVGLGKTIEAGLVWTELEARRQANRVLVVCPSSLVSKWRREMDERFGFDLVELSVQDLDAMLATLETNQVKRRIAYICSIERLRIWDGLERATDLGLNFDLVIVDEAHAFRNNDTKNFALGEELQSWAEALVMLSATPINLRSRDLYNLLSILVPGEFEDEESLALRVEPNRVLNQITSSLTNTRITNQERRGWLDDLRSSLFGKVLSARPDFKILQDLLAQECLAPADAVEVKRLCAELNALSAQITRTRKVEVQEERPLRIPQPVEVSFDRTESAFYATYLDWCKERAAAAGTPLNFSMQMPLRLAGSCLPEAAQSVLAWTENYDVEAEETSELGRRDARARSAAIPPHADLVAMAQALTTDTKFEQFKTVLDNLLEQERRAIVFTFSRRALHYLEKRLVGRYRLVLLHGGVPKRDRDRIMSAFRGGEFDFLLATKVASEGLDFEFCSAVVNYDLPWNPMEIEQRIGRIDRIGQREQKIAIWNFHTPGTIEQLIYERVHARIGVFERTIGQLEPILDSQWKPIEKLLFDFALTEEQRDQKVRDALLALEEQARALSDVETAAPVLMSSDGASIEGLEDELVNAGRYIGQKELAHLMADWADTFGGSVEVLGSVLSLVGNAEMADHVQTLVRTGERIRSEIGDYAALLRNEQPIVLSLDQEAARSSGLDLLTATHVLTRAATQTPGHRLGRYTRVFFTSDEVGIEPGTYLTLLSIVKWNGVRPFNEVWSSTVEIGKLNDVGPGLGAALMKGLAAGKLRAGTASSPINLRAAVDEVIVNLQMRIRSREHTLLEENEAFLNTRRTSLNEVHSRRAAHIRKAMETNIERGNKRVIRLNEAKLRKASVRLAQQLSALDHRAAATLEPEDLAICVVEIAP